MYKIITCQCSRAADVMQLVLVLLFVAGAAANHQLRIHNRCGYEVWVGILGHPGIPDSGTCTRPHPPLRRMSGTWPNPPLQCLSGLKPLDKIIINR